MEYWERKSLLGVFMMTLISIPASAQETLNDLRGSTYREKMVFAVYDIPSPEAPIAEIERIALSAIRLYARDAQVRHGIPPSPPYPAYPAKMALQDQGSGRPKATCVGELFSLSGIDTAHARSGEITGHRACLFPYAKGYRLNYFALHGQQSGLGNSNPNVAAAMAGRALANLFGIGDASKYIEKILDRMESGFKDAGIPFRMVQLHPANMPGRTVVTDDLLLTQPVQAVAAANEPAQTAIAPQPTQTPQAQPLTATVQPVHPGQQNLPPELEKLRQTLIEQRKLTRQQMAQRSGQPGFNSEQQNQLAARKELHAIGFQYFNRDQFLDAIKRGDRLVVELFVTAGGVGLNDPGANQLTPLKVAEASGQQELANYLRGKGAK
ncbi:MAG: hypothetical protein HONDAALG_04515 [Gammaproteobacteria bacterium]|nr:hypothetical protein [Gammaproteobacteria bacterium]